MPICKLCLQEKVLLKKSHIIPDFLYQNLFDKNHKLRLFSALDIIDQPQKAKKPSTGVYEGGILCAECDNVVIQSYEDYASRVIFGGEFGGMPAPETTEYQNTTPDQTRFTLVKNLDYTKYKLFLLSILWRASISKMDFFEEIYLGPHEEILRKMILNGDAGNEDIYQVTHLSYASDLSIPDMIAQPLKKRSRTGSRIYMFPMNGIFYTYYVNSPEQKIPFIAQFSTINKAGELKILHIPNGEGWEFVLRHFYD